MRPQIQPLRRVGVVSHFPSYRTLSQTPRFVHSTSSRRDVSLPTSPQVGAAQLLQSNLPPRLAKSQTTLARLPIEVVLRSYLITRMSSSPALLSVCFAVLRRMLDSKSWLMNVEKNPVLSKLLKSTFYAQFCVGESQSEVIRNTTAAREVLGYDGIILEYPLEVLGGSAPTAEETAREVENWRKGMLQTIEMAKEGDFIGLKWSGLGRHALHLLKTQQPATPEMWSAITAACDAAAAKNVALLPGAEEEVTNPGLEAWTLELQKTYNTPSRGRAIVYITYQCYLKGIAGRLAQHLAHAQNEGIIAGVKLVRGAYLASEPRDIIWETKEGTDANYDAMAEAALKREWTPTVPAPALAPSTPFPAADIVLATHNAASVHKAQRIRAAQLLHSPPEALPRLAYAQLLGMADEISQQLVQDKGKQADTQAKVVKCMTWGSTTDCLNYLMRRASENKEAAMRTEDTRRAMAAELWRRIKAVVGLA